MWALKIHYFLWFGSLSGIQPYVSIFARKHLDIDSDFIGILFFILPFVVFIVKPIVCSIADRYHRHSSALIVTQYLMTIGYGLLLLVPFLQNHLDADLLWWLFCLFVLIANTSNGPGVSLTDTIVINEVIRAQRQGDDKVNYGQYRIWGTIGYGIFGLLPGIINEYWIDIPYLVPGLIMFIAIEILDIICIYWFYHRKIIQENQSKRSDNDSTAVKYSSSSSSQPNEMTSIVTRDSKNHQNLDNNRIVTIENSRSNGEDDHDNDNDNVGGGGFNLIKRLKSIGLIFLQVEHIFLLYPELIHYCFLIFCFGILTAFHWSYFFWFIEDLRGHDTLLMSLCIFIEAFIGEVPIFYIAHHIIRIFGTIYSFCLALAAFSLRYFSYGYLLIKDIDSNRYWDILLCEILQGLTFSLFYVLMTHVAQKYADKCDRIYDNNNDDDRTTTGRKRFVNINEKLLRKMKKLKIKPSATMQGLMSGCFEGIGLGTGSLIGGFLIKKYDIRIIWRIGAYLSLILIALNLFIEFLKYSLNKKKSSSSNQHRPQQH